MEYKRYRLIYYYIAHLPTISNDYFRIILKRNYYYYYLNYLNIIYIYIILGERIRYHGELNTNKIESFHV